MEGKIIKDNYLFLSKMKKPSNSQVKKVGDSIRASTTDEKALNILNEWRAFHIYPLNTFQTTLKDRIKKNKIDSILTAQRLKRTPTIINKLTREPKMSLDRMQDIGGLRAVLKDISAVRKLESLYLKTKPDASSASKGVFRHILKSKKDYIESPKNSGYRGVHLIYKTQYEPKNEYCDLHIELQIRTKLQHIWATAVETIGTYLGQGFKFSQGEESWKDFFALVSSAFALMETSNKLEIHKDYDRDKIHQEIQKKYTELNVDSILKGFAISTKNILEEGGRGKFYCLINLDLNKKTVSVRKFPKNALEEANKALLESEKKENAQAVLVSISDIKKLDKAYPNYFLDADDFLNTLKQIKK